MNLPFGVLRVRNFRLHFAGQIVSNVGTWFQSLAQALLVTELTGSGKALGLVTALQFAPMLLLAPYGGVLADRVRPRPLLMVTGDRRACWRRRWPPSRRSGTSAYSGCTRSRSRSAACKRSTDRLRKRSLRAGRSRGSAQGDRPVLDHAIVGAHARPGAGWRGLFAARRRGVLRDQRGSFLCVVVALRMMRGASAVVAAASDAREPAACAKRSLRRTAPGAARARCS